jgi:regulator of protease activity HflC (stomatin/prohibitin superfamily)
MADLVVAVISILIIALLAVATARSVWVVKQTRARNVERFGNYRKTLHSGLHFTIPFVDRVRPLIDLREQVVAFQGQPVITEDNVVVRIDTVLFFQVTDPRAADYEITDYILAIEQLTATQLRNVIGTLDLEASLSSRDRINTALRGVLDGASGKWGIRVTRVEIKAIEPPQTIKDAMEKQMRAEREKRATILQAEGVRQSRILTAEGDKQGAILQAEGERQSAILRAQGEAQAIETVFRSIHENNADPKLLAYQYLQMLPQLAKGAGNTFWVIPSEVTAALQAVTKAFGGAPEAAGPKAAGPGDPSRDVPAPGDVPAAGDGPGPQGVPAPRSEALTPAEEKAALDAALDDHTPPFELAPGTDRA